jgi:hypothetical protein
VSSPRLRSRHTKLGSIRLEDACRSARSKIVFSFRFSTFNNFETVELQQFLQSVLYDARTDSVVMPPEQSWSRNHRTIPATKTNKMMNVIDKLVKKGRMSRIYEATKLSALDCLLSEQTGGRCARDSLTKSWQ